MKKFVFVLSSIICLSSLGDGIGNEAGVTELILTRLDSHLPWTRITNRIKNLTRSLQILGPDNRFLHVAADHRIMTELLATFSEVMAEVTTQPNFPYEGLTTDPSYDLSWGLANSGQGINNTPHGLPGVDIAAEKAWAIHTGGHNTIVAVLDTGIDLTHPEFSHNLWTNPTDGGFGWNFLMNTSDVQDDNGHGSLIAGIIGAEAQNGQGSRGINWRVKLMALKNLNEAKKGTTKDAISAITYAVNHGAHIINASWGGKNFDQALYDTVKWAGENSVLFVTASGNDRANNDNNLNATYPAAFRLPNIITAAGYDNRDEIWEQSNFGPKTVHVGAPAVSIFGPTLGGYRFGTGTSFAAAFVSGVAALVKSHEPQLGMRDLRERLLGSSAVIHYYEKERTQTAGRIHAANALTGTMPPRPVMPNSWQQINYNFATPHPYAHDTDEEIVFHEPGATHIRIHFRQFATEEKTDAVKLYDSNDKLVVSYHGNLGAFNSADAVGDTLKLRFTSDGSQADYGFDIDYFEAAY